MAERPSYGDYLRTLKTTVPRMINQIKELAAAELKPTAKHGGIGAGMFVAAAVIGLNVLLFILLTIAFAFSIIYYEVADLHIPTALTLGFLTSVVIGIIILAILGIIGFINIKKVKAPEATIAEAKASVAAISSAISSGSTDASTSSYPADAHAIIADERFTQPKPEDVEW